MSLIKFILIRYFLHKELFIQFLYLRINILYSQLNFWFEFSGLVVNLIPHMLYHFFVMLCFCSCHRNFLILYLTNILEIIFHWWHFWCIFRFLRFLLAFLLSCFFNLLHLNELWISSSNSFHELSIFVYFLCHFTISFIPNYSFVYFFKSFLFVLG